MKESAAEELIKSHPGYTALYKIVSCRGKAHCVLRFVYRQNTNIIVKYNIIVTLTTLKIINHQFLEPGHTMGCGSNHAIIVRAKMKNDEQENNDNVKGKEQPNFGKSSCEPKAKARKASENADKAAQGT
ncbi:hypothetical protein PV325_013448 [Microctonus aethiopoides]|nr:hypothetical protein PV325_013448 [Microctonus aethiopoides]